jgi:hypothetical protein
LTPAASAAVAAAATGHTNGSDSSNSTSPVSNNSSNGNNSNGVTITNVNISPIPVDVVAASSIVHAPELHDIPLSSDPTALAPPSSVTIHKVPSPPLTVMIANGNSKSMITSSDGNDLLDNDQLRSDDDLNNDAPDPCTYIQWCPCRRCHPADIKPPPPGIVTL